MNLNSKIFVAGHNGLVGSAIIRELKKRKFNKIITATRRKLDLTNQSKVLKFLKKEKPNFIIIAAAKVGGIYSNNKYKAEFIYENLMIQSNLIHSAYLCNIKNIIFLGSSCIYPKECKQPIKEEYLLNGKLEKTNDAYAIAKIAGIKMCLSYNEQYKTNYKCLMPTNTFGPNDNYHSQNSHFFPALIKKVVQAKKRGNKEIIIWGNGKARREIMYVDDLASACEFFLKKKTKHTLINIGSGVEMKIKDYATFICKKLNINLKFTFDKSKPNGTPRKILNTSLAKSYGWKSRFNLVEGFNLTIKDFLKK